jgi:hypothetical protein
MMITNDELRILKLALSYAYSNLNDLCDVTEEEISEKEVEDLMEKLKNYKS